jgi:S-adenosylmethionine decarboxylase proenzyme, Bacillus form
MNHLFKGNHILAEFYGISNTDNDKKKLESCLENCCKSALVTLLKFEYAGFDNGGYTAFALLAESHISIHTYPEHRSVFLDVFTCGNKNTMTIVELLTDYFKPENKHVRIINRGS